MCDSLLLQNSLEIFLREYLSSYKQCELVLSDKKRDLQKPVVIINSSTDADINVPFSKSSLLMELQKFYSKKYPEKKSQDTNAKKDNLWKLERKIDKLTLQFRENLIKTIRDFYEE
jgi:hypothetical protein